MQTLEAIISMFVFVAFASFLMLQLDNYNGLDDSLYRYQLANDVWRVLYLHGDFRDFSFTSASASRDDAQVHLEEIYDSSGVCAYLGGIRATSCPSESSCAEKVSSVKHVLIDGGIPKRTTLTLCIPG